MRLAQGPRRVPARRAQRRTDQPASASTRLKAVPQLPAPITAIGEERSVTPPISARGAVRLLAFSAVHGARAFTISPRRKASSSTPRPPPRAHRAAVSGAVIAVSITIRGGALGHDQPGGLEPIHHRHADIHEHGVRLPLPAQGPPRSGRSGRAPPPPARCSSNWWRRVTPRMISSSTISTRIRRCSPRVGSVMALP